MFLSGDSYKLSNDATPSRVIHLRNMSDRTSKDDLISLASPYGAISNIVLLKNSRQAMIEFSRIQSAIAFLKATSRNKPVLHNSTVYTQYSLHQSLESQEGKSPLSMMPVDSVSSTSDEPEASRVLLATILNVRYPIDVNVISQVFSPYEKAPRRTVEKIIVFRKPAGLHALVQFSNIGSAIRAKRELEGQNIFTGCCTLHVTFSIEKEIEISENSDLARDFTNPHLPYHPTPSDAYKLPDIKRTPTDSTQLSSFSIAPHQFTPTYGAPATGRSQGRGSSGYFPGSASDSLVLPHSVILVSNIPPESVSITELFNLFSNYGVIKRIKLLHEDDTKALIQFTSEEMSEDAIECLDRISLFGSVLSVVESHYDTIQSPIPVSEGGDGRTVDFQDSSLNRCRFGPVFLGKGTPSPPTAVLHVSNMSPTTSEESLMQHLQTRQPHRVNAIRMIDSSSSSSSSSMVTKRMALVKFDDEEKATEVMCLMHNSALDGMNIRLSFSSNKI
ncbi:RNA recognition domain containing protein [Monocercomonoides exilis]|uniref:RNA recognition domain containing protein n=1 Tax=Monocercomonoides exilis TaxID=2049356 RepID=UPI00355A2C5B|nr:RNA recognition domain containing protein [Monocercomonoides exilis]|eukprot:MONOS_6997.1-p1 / transcript=MONOS_6997.1 / gene=MONOS_6997 / organism=Monocercomonoides_exilis_PA203 / gene_product=RNA recognition domain containing protein / transcript_product=RNA recognition domain containing protein / location=Mono_scaffold00230:49091-50946(+) / protein_length=502 / sequence_SO=supercontig / SO=protein_coding / is_pseudo=false